MLCKSCKAVSSYLGPQICQNLLHSFFSKIAEDVVTGLHCPDEQFAHQRIMQTPQQALCCKSGFDKKDLELTKTSGDLRDTLRKVLSELGFAHAGQLG